MNSIIYEFCKHAEHIYIGSEDTTSILRSVLTFDLSKDEIFRTRYDIDLSCIFTFSLGMKEEPNLGEEVSYMQTIEMFYPNMFDWRFDGKHIEAIGLIRMKKENLGIFTRYKNIYNFIRYLRRQLVNVLRYRDYGDIIYLKYVDDKILALGSLNTNTNLYVINILPTDNEYDILSKSRKRIITTTSIKELLMKFWVKEINPDYYKEVSNVKSKNKYKLTDNVFEHYPPCIKKISKLKKKGNHNRFLLATFLLGVHHERDAKHQLDSILSDDEREHINSGNCKEQWRTILAKEYPTPSCKTMIENGYCEEDCGRPTITTLEVKNERTHYKQ